MAPQTPERRSYNIGETKVPYDDRTAVHEIIDSYDDDLGFLDVIGSDCADDDERHPVGSPTTYHLWLTEDEAETLRAQEHVRFVEEQEEHFPHYAGNDRAANIPAGETKDYMRWGSVDLSVWHGTDVIVGVMDQGTTKAVRDFMGFNLITRKTIDTTPYPAGKEIYDPEVDHDHGCLVGPNAAPPGGSIVDVDLGSATSGSSNDTSFAAAVRFCVDNGAKVCNYSFGSAPVAGKIAPSSTAQDAITYAKNAGVVITVSMGNDSTAGMGSSAVASLPSQNTNVASVTAFDERYDQKAAFTNYDERATLSSPGVRVYSLTPGGAVKLWDGTSAAAPFTAQCVARLCTGGVYTPLQAFNALKATLRDSGTGAANQGGGVIDFAAAVAYLTGQTQAQPALAAPTHVASRGLVGYGTSVTLSFAEARVGDLKVITLVTNVLSANEQDVNPVPVPTGWTMIRRQISPTSWRPSAALGGAAIRTLVFVRLHQAGDDLSPPVLFSTTGAYYCYWGTVCTIVRSPNGIDVNKLVAVNKLGNSASPSTLASIPRTTNDLVLNYFFQRDPDSATGTLSVPSGLNSYGFWRATSTQSAAWFKALLAGVTTGGSSARQPVRATASNQTAEWSTVALVISPSPSPKVPAKTYRTNMAIWPEPLAAVANNGMNVRYIRPGIVCNLTVGQTIRSSTAAQPAGASACIYYWYANLTNSDGSTSTAPDFETRMSDGLVLPEATGKLCTFSWFSYFTGTARLQVALTISWYAGATLLSTTVVPKLPVNIASESWKRMMTEVTVPATATRFEVLASYYGVTETVARSLRWSSVLYEVGGLDTYFDPVTNANALWDNPTPGSAVADNNGTSTLYLDLPQQSEGSYAFAG